MQLSELALRFPAAPMHDSKRLDETKQVHVTAS